MLLGDPSARHKMDVGRSRSPGSIAGASGDSCAGGMGEEW